MSANQRQEIRTGRARRGWRSWLALAALFAALCQALSPLHAVAASIGGGTDIVAICSGNDITYVVLGADGVPVEQAVAEPCEHCCLTPQAALPAPRVIRLTAPVWSVAAPAIPHLAERRVQPPWFAPGIIRAPPPLG